MVKVTLEYLTVSALVSNQLGAPLQLGLGLNAIVGSANKSS